MNQAEPDAGEGGAGAPPDTHHSNKAPDLTREYRADGITVFWYARRCIHAGACIMKAPRAFNPRRRPWIDLARADLPTIKQAVDACPTGALEYVLDNGEREPAGPTISTMVEGGPHLLRGRIEIQDPQGNVIRRASRVALCRCGKSGNMPFCDNSHRAIERP